MKIPLYIAEKLISLSEGAIIPASSARHSVIEELVIEGIIIKTGRIQKTLRIFEIPPLFLFLQNKYGINDLKKYIEIIRKEDHQRNELVAVSSDSKLKKVRTFKGFLINSYQAIPAKLNNQITEFNFIDGIFQFISDFEKFIPASNITIIGIENPENFRFIERQKYLFNDIQPLFISRYPQHQSRDMIKWLQSISNPYLHFGDFDFAGIGIYINEFKKYLGEKATFFVPDNIENLISENGNRNRYDKQKINYPTDSIQEENLIFLINTIHKYKKGLDQEILII